MRRVRLDVASVAGERSGGGGRGVVEKFNAAVRMNSNKIPKAYLGIMCEKDPR